MNYYDFEDHIHTLILERGKEYFDKGAIKDLDRTADGWKAVIEGQQEYEVIITGEEELVDWFCNCPHAHGPVCKHVAAVLYAIRASSINAKDILAGMNADELRDFINSHLKAHPGLIQELKAFIGTLEEE